MYRGSRKHVLDWTDRPTFVVELLQLVAPVDCKLTARSQWMPRGHGAPDEARLETFGPSVMSGSEVWEQLRRWWLAHERGANTPNWDLALACEVQGRPGLILVEAKANVPELSAGGKPSGASVASGENHDRIGTAIAEANAALQRLDPATALSRDSHYQLSNRVAFAWKLASMGVPTVLVYLGFLGDKGIADAGAPFDSAQAWESVFAQHANSVVPAGLRDVAIDCGAAPMWLLVRSRPVWEVSPPRG